MSAAQTCSGHLLPKSSLGTTSLRECTRRKRDNIVLIEVDSDDFGDVIILDVPESFKQKFRKKPKHVISIDDDDDDSECRSEDCVQNGNTTISNRSPHSSSDCPNADDNPISEGNIPVNLSKSKRTYSGKTVPRNRYGLSSDFESCSSDSECSDCEFMGDSRGSLHGPLEKASFTRGHDTSSTFPDPGASTLAPKQPFHYWTEDFTADEHFELPGQQSKSSDDSPNHETGYARASAQKLAEGSLFPQMGSNPALFSDVFRQKSDSCSGPFDVVDKGGTFTSDCPLRHCTNSMGKDSEPLGDTQCNGSSKYVKSDSSGDFTKEVVSDCNYTQRNADGKEVNEVSFGDYSADIIRVPSESKLQRQHGTGDPLTLSNNSSTLGHETNDNEAKSFSDRSTIVIDRQKLKETDEYKRAMEEEWACRQQQLEQQAEEAQRLRNRKKAENLRMMANEKRQLERVAEIRESRRKDEESLNLKDQLRVEIRKQLRRLELMCGDMSSLLRCLGIPVSGGLYPSQTEVQAAYRQARLKFHPDRFAAHDLRQQIEAEEKFKLISNMKDKFHL